MALNRPDADITFKLVLQAPRGTITDRTGQALAMSVDSRAVYAEPRTIAYDQIDRARTVFEWGATPKPGGPKKVGPKRASATTTPNATTMKHTDHDKEQTSQ